MSLAAENITFIGFASLTGNENFAFISSLLCAGSKDDACRIIIKR